MSVNKIIIKNKKIDGAKHLSKKKRIKENIKGTHHTNDITSGLVKKPPIKEADYSLHYSSSFKGGLHTQMVYTHVLYISCETAETISN